MRRTRLVAHQPDGLHDPRIRRRAGSNPEQFPRRTPRHLGCKAAFRDIGEQFEHGPLVAQVERRARSNLTHPLAERRQIAAERVDIEKSHAAAIDAQMMQAVRQDQHAARPAPGRRAGSGIVGYADRSIERNRKHAGGVTMRRQPERRAEIENPRAPIEQYAPCAARP